ncbi:MAG: MATE family efflux transporter [Oribacterium sp.]|nr:MATE family efflux transporter [Oribacterium sp.]
MAQHNLAKGDLFHNMILFSLPYLLSYFLQTLYGLADLLIAGRFNGADVISAVSIGSQIMHMVTVMIVGLAMGTTVMIGRFVGAEDEDGIRRAIGNTITLFAMIAALATCALLGLTQPIVQLLSTPPEAVPGALAYLRICFAGIPFIVAYNILSSIFRGMGDSRSPMLFIAVACALNILLDLLFMGPMQLGAAGAALATVVAQAASVAFALVGIWKTTVGCRQHGNADVRNTSVDVATEKSKGSQGQASESVTSSNGSTGAEAAGTRMKAKQNEVWWAAARADRSAWWDPAMLHQILSIGLPIACQDGFIQISFLIITVIANRRGVDISAAVGIVEKTISFLFLVPSSMLSTVSTIAAQSIGAGDPARARQTLRYGIGIASGIGLLFAILFQFISVPFFTLFTKDPVVQALAVQYMCTYVLDCVVAGIHFPFSGFFSASGLSILSFIHNLCSVILVRIPGAWLATKLFPDTLYAMGLAAPAGSLLSALICIAFYLALRRQGRV